MCLERFNLSGVYCVASMRLIDARILYAFEQGRMAGS